MPKIVCKYRTIIIVEECLPHTDRNLRTSVRYDKYIVLVAVACLNSFEAELTEFIVKIDNCIQLFDRGKWLIASLSVRDFSLPRVRQMALAASLSRAAIRRVGNSMKLVMILGFYTQDLLMRDVAVRNNNSQSDGMLE